MTQKIKPESLVIGQRVQFGVIVGSMVSFACWLWNLSHPPQAQIPAEQAVVLQTIVTGIGQIVIVNWLGVTVPK